MASDKGFYIADNGEQRGPFCLAELGELRIIKSTLIWKEGYEDWVEAEKIPELNSILKRIPPPIPKTTHPIKEEEKAINVNLTIGKKKEIDKIDDLLQNKKRKAKTAKEIKILFKIFAWGLLVAILFYVIDSFIVKDGFSALMYRTELKNCDSNCSEVRSNIIYLGKKHNTLRTYKMERPSTQTELRMTEGVYWKPDLIKYYSTRYDLQPESIVNYEHWSTIGEDFLHESGKWYTRIEVAYPDYTVDITIENAFENALLEAFLFFLIATFSTIIGRYMYFFVKRTKNFIDLNSK